MFSCLAYAALRAEIIGDLSCLVPNFADKFQATSNTTKAQREAGTSMIREKTSEALDNRIFTIVSKFIKATEIFL